MNLKEHNEGCYTVFKKNNFKCRKDNDDFYIIWCQGSKKWYCATSTFYEIISLCDGRNSIDDISRIFSKQYADVPLDKLSEDVQRALIQAKELNIVTEVDEK